MSVSGQRKCILFFFLYLELSIKYYFKSGSIDMQDSHYVQSVLQDHNQGMGCHSNCSDYANGRCRNKDYNHKRPRSRSKRQTKGKAVACPAPSSAASNPASRVLQKLKADLCSSHDWSAESPNRGCCTYGPGAKQHTELCSNSRTSMITYQSFRFNDQPSFVTQSGQVSKM